MTAYVTQDMHRQALGQAAQRIAHLEREVAELEKLVDYWQDPGRYASAGMPLAGPR